VQARGCSAAASVAVFLLLLSVAAALPMHAQPSDAARPGDPRIVVAEYDGIIHPIAVEFCADVIARAEVSGATAVIIQLRTPGGLLDATRSLISRMIDARIPVIVYVGPAGARAASAGFLITIAADLAVMAPGTHIGAAHPVSAGGDAPDSDSLTAKKATEDTAAYARTLAAARGRNVALAAEAVTASRAFTETEALNATPPLIDFVARHVDDLVSQLHGREVKRFDGRSVMLQTRGATLERIEMTRRQQWLSAIAHPQLAYILLSLGMLGLMVEFWNPGAILPGVAGGLSLLIAFFAFQVLSVNVAGLLLIAFGIGLLLLELKVPSFGALGVGGTIALLVGSLMITRDVPGVTVSVGVVAPIALTVAGILLFLGRLSLRAQRQAPATGAEALITQQGVALTPLTRDAAGQVRVHGEIWRAAAARPIAPGARIRVIGRDGLTLQVEPSDSDGAEGGPR
jgi:membrane-bound serine protease (ClpP class)